MRQLTIIFLLFATTTNLLSQSDFAPLGATWKYTLHRFIVDFPYECEYNICDQSKQRLEVVDTTTLQGKKVSILRQFFGDSDMPDGPEITIHSRNDSVFFWAYDEFHLLYDFTAEDGDTINITVPTYYDGPGTLSAAPFVGMDTIVNLDVLVQYKDSILVSGEKRRRVEYRSADFPNTNFTLPNIIDGIGSGHAFFGYTGAFVSDGCFGYFICYEDENQAYTPFGCCVFPEDYPERTFAPLGAEWLYEGWSNGEPGEEGCDHGCEGNYNLFRVEAEANVGGRVHAVVRRYHRTKDSEWEATGDQIRLYDFDGGFYASNTDIYSLDQFYRVDVEVGDVMSVSAPQNYPKFIGDDVYEYPYPREGGDQLVEAVDTIIIDGQPRVKVTFRDLDGFRLGEVIEGIGPLYDGLLGYDQSIPGAGCPPRLLCYRDENIEYTTTDCGCEFPMGPLSAIDIESDKINIYPNPAKESIFIDNKKKLHFDQLEIYDMQGRLVRKMQYTSHVELSSIDKGVYMLRLSDEKRQVTKKFVKL